MSPSFLLVIICVVATSSTNQPGHHLSFYRHYQDKYDLVAKIFEEAANHLVEDMKHLHKDIGPAEKVEL